MDRARTELTELEAVYGKFPEFRRFTRRLRYVSAHQQHRIILRMARHAARLSGGCIVWCGNCNNDGYGRMGAWVRGIGKWVSFYVHHLSFSMANAREPRPWEERSHTCDTPACFNPDHLVAERIRVNRERSARNTHRKMARALKRGRAGSDWRAEA